MKIYMDTCCLSRPFDDPTHNKIHIEAEAINQIITLAKLNKWTVFSSEAIDFELNKLTKSNKKERITFYQWATNKYIHLTSESTKRARYFQKLGIKLLDSYHLALAEENDADLFFTTDDNLLFKAKRIRLNMETANPTTWLMEISNGH